MKEGNMERLRKMRRNHFYYRGIGLIVFAIILGITTMLSYLGVIQVSSDWISALLWGSPTTSSLELTSFGLPEK